MYTLKSTARRGTALASAAALVVATILPASAAFADALNPLTHRSLTLSSSSPGWSFTDGSGNATYAPPNSGANGQKTGNTFTFNVSTDSSSSNTVKAYTFQYCTTSAGQCTSPGNGDLDVATKKSNLDVVTSSPSELSAGNFASLIDANNGNPTAIPNRNNSQGNFVVLTKDVGDSVWTRSAGWTMTSSNLEDGSNPTGKNNYITIANTAGGMSLHSDGQVKVIFFGTDTNYITNPGAGAFFVKINNYGSATVFDDTTLIDGGVTVANVMNQSIEIQTKVLETMDFSVGTVDPYTLESDGTATSQLHAANSNTTHGQCDPVLMGMTQNPATPNVLQIGDTNAENSLSTTKTYSTHSYWRLSSNSSAGATVYYSGVTLKNTVGDEIAAIGTTATSPMRGTPQFGLALANGSIANNTTVGPYAVDYDTETDSAKGVFENGADNGTDGIHASVATDVASLTGYHAPRLWPLIPEANYDLGAGVVNNEYELSANAGTTTKFAFDPTSNTIPTPLASQNSQVVDCVTGKVRYIANIAATTPAGIYTTKINYIAAPQY